MVGKSIFYILVFVVVFIYSLQKEKRNAPKSGPSDMKPQPSKESLDSRPFTLDESEDISQELSRKVSHNMGDNQSSDHARSKSESQKIKENPVRPFLTNEYEAYDSPKTGSDRKNKNKKSKKVAENAIAATEIGSKNEISLDTPEDVRRAFIYSEVLNRKYC